MITAISIALGLVMGAVWFWTSFTAAGQMASLLLTPGRRDPSPDAARRAVPEPVRVSAPPEPGLTSGC